MKNHIEKYKVHGNIFIWAFKENQTNYPGWNITLDLIASKSLVELLNLMQRCEWSIKKKMNTEKPTDFQLNVPNNKMGNAKWISKNIMTLNCKKSENVDHWDIKESENEIEIQFGESKLLELQKSIMEIANGKGDFAIYDENEESILNFWWNLNK